MSLVDVELEGSRPLFFGLEEPCEVGGAVLKEAEPLDVESGDADVRAEELRGVGGLEHPVARSVDVNDAQHRLVENSIQDTELIRREKRHVHVGSRKSLNESARRVIEK